MWMCAHDTVCVCVTSIYAAEVLLALEHLHSYDIVYRCVPV
jgi:hypothetical protein